MRDEGCEAGQSNPVRFMGGGHWMVALTLSIWVLLCLAALTATGWTQDAPAEASTPDAPAPRDTFFEHSNTAKWWVSGQANFVFQAHGDFYAAYSGPNSLHDTAEQATSRVLTLFTGYEFSPSSILYLDVEEAGWGGISGALGLAGFTNLDVVRNPQLGTAPYIARLMFQQIIPFSKEKIEIPRGPLTLADPASGAAVGNSFWQILDGRLFRQQCWRIGQPLPIPELDGRQ